MAATKVEDLIGNLRQQFALGLPGAAAQARLAPSHRFQNDSSLKPLADAKQAGVLLLLYPEKGELILPMIRRPYEPGPHSRQIAFPGGRREEGDTDLIETALRETREEIGVIARRADVLGVLSPVFVPPSGYLVTPSVAILSERPVFVPDPREVEEVLTFRVADFLDPANFHSEEWNVRGRQSIVPHFRIGAEVVWGASAMMLAELLAILEDADLQRDPLTPPTQ